MAEFEVNQLLGALPKGVVQRVREGVPVTLVVTNESGRVSVREIDAEQAWFWTPEWQAKEREVDEVQERGEPGAVFTTGDEFLAWLDERIERASA